VTVGAVNKQLSDFKQSLKITRKLVPTLDLKMFDLGGRLSPEQRLIQLAQYRKTFNTAVMPSLTKLYEHRQSLKVQPEPKASTEPEPSVQEEKTEHKKDKTEVNKKMSNKTVLGGTNKNAWHLNLTVKG